MRIVSFRLAIALSIIVAVVIVSVAAYYARQLSTTTIIKISPQEDTVTSTSTSSTGMPASEHQNILVSIGDWAISIILQDNGTGILRVEYIGEKPLTIENPLLPLTAGLDIALEYADPSRNTIIKGLGTYYYNASITIEHGNYSQMKFDSRNLTSIRIEGEILGQIPVRIYIPLAGVTCLHRAIKTVTVTVTEPVTSQKTATASAEKACKLELIGEYREQSPGQLRREIEDNQTIYTDNVIEVHIPLEVYSTRIPLTIINKGRTPLVIHRWYFEYEIVNISFDGEHYIQVNKKIAYAAPTTTIPPWIMDCISVDNDIRVWGVNDILMPGQSTTLVLDVPDNILGDHYKVWLNARLSLEYQEVKQLFKIRLNNTVWKYSLAAKTYEKINELSLVFNTRIVRE